MNRLRDGVLSRGKPFQINVATQHRYVNQIQLLVDKMQRDTREEITKLFASQAAQHYFASDTVGMDATIAAEAKRVLNALKRGFDQIFGRAAAPVSNKMADDINRHSHSSSGQAIADMPIAHAKDWSISLRKLSPATHQLLKSSSAASANFITSIPERYLNSVADAVYNSIAAGNGIADLEPYLDKYDSTTKNWAKNTALDQTRKAYNGLNAGRMKAAGVTRGEWLHSGGSLHPRPEHEAFDGQSFDLSVGAPVGDDGGYVMPGEDINCRCTFAPIVEIDDEEVDDSSDN